MASKSSWNLTGVQSSTFQPLGLVCSTESCTMDFQALEIDDDLVGIVWRCSAVYAATLGISIGLRGDYFNSNTKRLPDLFEYDAYDADHATNKSAGGERPGWKTTCSLMVVPSSHVGCPLCVRRQYGRKEGETAVSFCPSSTIPWSE